MTFTEEDVRAVYAHRVEAAPVAEIERRLAARVTAPPAVDRTSAEALSSWAATARNVFRGTNRNRAVVSALAAVGVCAAVVAGIVQRQGDGRVGPSATALNGTWVIATIDGRTVHDRSITLRFASGRVSGVDGCNSFGGSARVDGDTLRISELAYGVIRSECDGALAANANAIDQMLRDTSTWSVGQGVLTLTGSSAGRLVYRTSSPHCPFTIPHVWAGGDCAGELSVGVNATHAFTPRVSYRIPTTGWNNVIDFPGVYVLLPPGGSVDGINGGASDDIYLFSNVYALNRRCTHEGEITRAQPGVGHTAAAIAHELATRPGVIGSEPKPVEIDNLNGYMIDVRIDPQWNGHCFFDNRPMVPMIGGRPPSGDFIHLLQADWTYRYYFLDHGGKTIAIEIQDVGRDDRDTNAEIVKTFRFD